MRLVSTLESPRLVTARTGIYHTTGMISWAQIRLSELEKEDLCGFVFKSRSPSSGMRGVKVYSPSGIPSNKGIGIFAAAFMASIPPNACRGRCRMHDPVLRENFIERVFVFKRWKEFKGNGGSLRDLIAFHSDHKLLILAHSLNTISLWGDSWQRQRSIGQKIAPGLPVNAYGRSQMCLYLKEEYQRTDSHPWLFQEASLTG